MNPLHFGNLIKQINNIFIIHVNIRNLALITQHDNFNTVELYNQGVLVIKYSDHKIDDSNFVRSLDNKKFSFKNGELISINKLITAINNIFKNYKVELFILYEIFAIFLI
jgi:hypothetical protein